MATAATHIGPRILLQGMESHKPAFLEFLIGDPGGLDYVLWTP